MKIESYFEKYKRVFGISKEDGRVYVKRFTDIKEAKEWQAKKKNRQLVSKWAVGEMINWY